MDAYFEAEPGRGRHRPAARARAERGGRRAGGRAARRRGLGDAEPGRARADPRRPLLRPHARASRRGSAGRGRLRDRRRPRLRHRPARDHHRLPDRARPAEGDRRQLLTISPISAPAPACSPSPRMQLWPAARAVASDIDPVAIEVAAENAAVNRVRLGRARGQLELIVAPGLDHLRLKARAPYDLLIANILAGPLIDARPGAGGRAGAGRPADPRRPARPSGRSGRRRLSAPGDDGRRCASTAATGRPWSCASARAPAGAKERQSLFNWRRAAAKKSDCHYLFSRPLRPRSPAMPPRRSPRCRARPPS